jgi:hypothetical protein
VSAEEYSMPFAGWNPQLAGGRADPEIACDTARAMGANAAVPEEWIEILVNQGFVTLAGTVEWDYQRNHAEFCVRNVAGVRGVINLIKVTPQAPIPLFGSVHSWFDRQEKERAARRIA